MTLRGSFISLGLLGCAFLACGENDC